METGLEGSIVQMMATLFKLLPMDLIKHLCTFYSNCVHLIQDYVLPLCPQLKTVNNDN